MGRLFRLRLIGAGLASESSETTISSFERAVALGCGSSMNGRIFPNACFLLACPFKGAEAAIGVPKLGVRSPKGRRGTTASLEVKMWLALGDARGELGLTLYVRGRGIGGGRIGLEMGCVSVRDGIGIFSCCSGQRESGSSLTAMYRCERLP
jgi:hypothetical protein